MFFYVNGVIDLFFNGCYVFVRISGDLLPDRQLPKKKKIMNPVLRIVINILILYVLAIKVSSCW